MYQDFILTVDYGRPQKRRTSGWYQVCAKNEKQAEKLLQEAIGTGKIQCRGKAKETELKPKEVMRIAGTPGNSHLEPIIRRNELVRKGRKKS